MAQQIFISYSRVDSENTEKLIRRLKRTFPDFTIWHDSHLSSRGGQKWWDAILDAIEGSDVFLYLLSNESLASPYCQAEFAEAQRLERPFIAVQLRDRTQIPDTLDDYQYINLANYKGEDDPYDDLVASINRLLPEGTRAKRKKFPKKNRTVKPGKLEASGVPERTDVVTPPLVIPSAAQSQSSTAQYIIAAIGAIAVIVAAVITIIPAILTRIDNARATQIAQAPTDTATVSPNPSPTIPTNTPSLTPTISTNTPIPNPTSAANDPLALAERGVTSNAEWTPYVQEFNGVEMVLVPSGTFTMGSTQEEIDTGFAMCQAAADNGLNVKKAGLRMSVFPPRAMNKLSQFFG